MTRIYRRIAFLTFIAAMLVTGCGKKEEAVSPVPPSPPPSAPPPSQQAPPPVVQVTKAVEEEKEARGFEAIAVLEGATSTEVDARATGYLIRQDYQEGASVKQGDLLFEMDARPFAAALDEAKAGLADKRARSAMAADVDAAQAAVTAAQVNLAATRIAAPVGGMAGRAVPGLGDLIRAGALLTTISTVDPMKAVFTLPKQFYLDNSERIAKVLALAPESRPETLELVLADGTRYSHKGRWDFIGAPASASSGPVASALFPNPDRALRPGEYVKVDESNP
jgi:membrane fusion protein, multidrug efflux system